jgi:hypothetical protein
MARAHELQRFSGNCDHAYYTEIKYLYKYLYKQSASRQTVATKPAYLPGIRSSIIGVMIM